MNRSFKASMLSQAVHV